MTTRHRWFVHVLGVAGVVMVAGCGLNRPAARFHAAGAADVERQLDTRTVDVDGDGDRSILSGANNVNNPPWDLRNQPAAHAASPSVVHGRYAGNAYADTLARLVLSAPNVTAAVAVLHGQVIVMGVDVRPEVPVDFPALEHEIRRRLMIHAPEFRYVYVTRKRADVMTINHVADGLRTGVPFAHYRNQLVSMLQTMTPIPLQ